LLSFIRDYKIPLYGSFSVERQLITILFTNVNVSDVAEVGMKLLNTETLVTRNTIREILLNIHNFTSTRLPTQGMTKIPSLNRQNVSLSSKLANFPKLGLTLKIIELHTSKQNQSLLSK
jgi:hypothetical protein